MSIESGVELLSNCAKMLSGQQHIHKLLKSYYINTCRKLAKNCVQFQTEKFGLSQMCPHCGSIWNESEFRLKFIPKQLKITSRATRIMKILEDVGKSNNLSKRQKSRAKWLKKKYFSRLGIECRHCKHESFAKIENGKKKCLTKNTNHKKVCTVDRKKCEDLKSKVVKSLKSARTDPKNYKVEEKRMIASPKIKPKSKESSSSKLISKTRKQNSLLQLASLLQKQTKDVKESAQKKLQSFFK